MSELQPDNGITFDDSDVQEPQGAEPKIDEVDVAEDQPESPEGSESAPDDTDKNQAVKFDEKQQEKVNELIASKVRKQHEAERKAERLERELQEFKSKLPQQTRPDIPPLPDPFILTESEYKAKIEEREQAIRVAAGYDAEVVLNERRAQEARQAADAAKNEALANEVRSYSQRAVKLGMTPEELQSAGGIMAQFGLGGPEHPLTQVLLADEQGPLIVKYLSKNIMELEQIAAMNPIQAAIKIATEIKSKAVPLKTKVNPAPDPVDSPRSSGPTKRQFGPKGATYE
jgi:hypothetical protein